VTQLAAIETLVVEPTLTGEHGRNRGVGQRQITANDDWSGVPSITGYLGDIDAGSPDEYDPDARFIEAARHALPKLIAKVRELEAELVVQVERKMGYQKRAHVAEDQLAKLARGVQR